MSTQTKTRSPLRDNLFGIPEDNDRLWLLHDNAGNVYAITEYNDELTGYDPRLATVDPALFHYGTNAYYITNTWIRRQGWRAERHEDRR